MGVDQLKTIYTVARDMDALHAFYRDCLGMEPRFRDDQRWSQFALGPQGGPAFALSSQDEAPPGAIGWVPVFSTGDLAASTSKVLASGGRLVQQRDMGAHGSTATFSDPEGNLFQLFCRAPSTPSAAS